MHFSNLTSPLSYYLVSDISWKKTWKAKDVDVPLPACSHCLLNVRCCRSWARHRIKHVWSFQVWNVEPMQKCFTLPFIWNGQRGRTPLAPMWKIAATVCSLVLSQMQSVSELHPVDQIWLFYKTKMATNTKLEATKCQWVMSRWVYHPVHLLRAP